MSATERLLLKRFQMRIAYQISAQFTAGLCILDREEHICYPRRVTRVILVEYLNKRALREPQEQKSWLRDHDLAPVRA